MKDTSNIKSDPSTERKPYREYQDNSDAWVDLYRSNLQLLANDEHDTAIANSLKVLNRLDTFKLMFLDICSAAYAKKGDFGKALETTKIMIQCAPTNATGYLRAGDIFVLQGKHNHAIQVYDQGIKYVSSDNSQYGTLKNRKEAVWQTQIRKRVDFLTKLPINIAHVIIDQLDIINHGLGCLDVSKKWRQILVDYAQAWKTLLLHSSTDNTIFRFLPLIGKQTQTFRLTSFDKDKSQKISKALLSGHFSNLQIFYLHRCDVERHQILLILAQLGSTLTELTVDVRTNKQANPIGTILATCPKLTVFRYFNDQGDMEFGEPCTSIAKKTNIKSLFLSAKSLSTEVLEATLRQCPKLEDLRLKGCTADTLKPINDHCPNLVYLAFNGSVQGSPARQETHGHSPGLQYMSIHNTAGMDPRCLIHLLKKSQSTLQTASITFVDEGSDKTELWNGLAKLKFKKMHHFTYCQGASNDIHVAVARMMENCNALQSASLKDLNNVPVDLFAKALLALPALTALNLLDLKKDNVDVFTRFLSAHASKGKSSSLRKIQLNQCNSFSDSLLETLATIETLEAIEIYNCDAFTTDGLVEFAKQLCVNNTVDRLHLSNMDTVSNLVLCSIRNISSLQYLGLVGLPDITLDALYDLAGGMNNLKHLYVLGCPQISLNAYNNIVEKLSVKNKTQVKNK